jgi:hypothetical protein
LAGCDKLYLFWYRLYFGNYTLNLIGKGDEVAIILGEDLFLATDDCLVYSCLVKVHRPAGLLRPMVRRSRVALGQATPTDRLHPQANFGY